MDPSPPSPTQSRTTQSSASEVSGPPQAPRMRAGDLPSDGSSQQSTSAFLDTTNSDYTDLTPSQLYELNASLLEDAVPKRDLIGPIAPMAVLRAEYENGSAAFVQQIDWLVAHNFVGVRRSRGDGNCFYRSLAFVYVERVLHASDPELASAMAMSTLEATAPLLELAGFQRLVFEDFLEVLTGLLQHVSAPGPDGRTLTPAGLLAAFQSAEVSNSVVVYLRLLTSAQIRADEDSYAPFLFHPETGEPMEVREFCESFVEAVDKEADHVQVTALSRALGINVDVAYLDGRDAAGTVDFVKFHNGESEAIGAEPLVLLYRPGHYDILEDRTEEPLE